MKLLRALVAILAAALSAAGVSPAAPTAGVERWGLWEAEFTGPADGNPYTDVDFAATFTQGDQSIRVLGFWDGDNAYRVRFSPPSEGEWRYVTRSNRAGLDSRSGTLTAAPPSAANHGPVKVFRTHYLRRADGTPYHQYGTTCYAWIHQPEDLQETTLLTLARAPFNKIRFCVFPKSYVYNKNEPDRFAFVRRDDRSFDFDRPDPAFWRHLERRILDLQRLGIEADLILWHPYDRWGFSEMSTAQDDRYLRYCIARLSAFRNVWWSLANEYDLMAPNTAKGHRGNKTMDDWDRFFRILEREDHHQRLRSIHNCRGFYDHTKPWVTHGSLQTSDMAAGVRFRAQFGKPVIYDECKYEGDVPEGWGKLTAREMTQRFWLGTLSGCYVGHGETYRHPDDILWWSKGGVLHGQSPPRIQWLKEVIARAPPFDELQPLGDGKDLYLLAKPGEFYLLYCPDGRPRTIDLPGSGVYKVDLLDPWAMTETPLGEPARGAWTVSPPCPDVAFRFTVYRPGEPRRPAPRIHAEPTAGRAPLRVTFRGSGGDSLRWTFADGTSATGLETVHTFSEPGIHTVSLAATDGRGTAGHVFATVLADGDPDRPLLRAGFPRDETHRLTLHGTVRRGADGALMLPPGPPWGWVQAGSGPAAELAGLRSFTLLGWLKPERLDCGSGGNRILFCLNRDRAGIDLVHLADGRLRLAVNQWPDRVSNDSSPGRLIAGQWTFFAVAYDGSRATDNVHWFFSSPAAALGAVEPVPDRLTSHDAGPVGNDIGPLALGNFNPTLQSAGMDRQFRGEIRGIQIYGSRLDGGGAMDAAAIRRHAR